MMEEVHPIVRSSEPNRCFIDVDDVVTVAVFPDGQRMATSSSDGMVRLWDLKTSYMLMELEGRGAAIGDMALSRNGKLIASSDEEGYVIAWDGDTGRKLTAAFRPHPNSDKACPLDFSPEGATLAIGSDYTTKLWNTENWKWQGKSFEYSSSVTCIRYSPSGELLAVATNHDHIYIWKPATKERIAKIVAPLSVSLAWTPDSIRLLFGSNNETTIQEWHSLTRTQVNGVALWKGRTEYPWRLAMNCDGTVVACLTTNNRVRLWRLSDQQTIAIFEHSDVPCCITFSTDGKYVFAGGRDKKVSEWAVPKHAWPEDATPNNQAKHQPGAWGRGTGVRGSDANAQDSNTRVQGSNTGAQSKIFDMKVTVRNACMSGDLTTAEDLLTQEVDANDDDHYSYANRSVVMARKLDWDRAMDDATKSLSIRPSMMGYISKGIALCGKQQVQDAREAFDLSLTFVNGDPASKYFISMIMAVALFNGGKCTEAMGLVLGLTSISPDDDATLARALEVYFHIQLGNNAMDRNCPSEAADHFTNAVQTSILLSNLAIDSRYEDLVILFGCDLSSLWQSANQKRCCALLRAGKLAEASEAYRHMVDKSDEAMKPSCLDWSIGFIQELTTYQSHLQKQKGTA